MRNVLIKLADLPPNKIEGQVLRAPFRLIPRRLPLPILTGPLRGRTWLARSSRIGCWLGTFEHEKQQLFRQAVRPGSVVLDIGAHVGFYTVLASVQAGPSGRVYAFEPLPRNIAHLRSHIGLNRLGNVTVVEAAVGAQTGIGRFDDLAASKDGALGTRGHLSTSGALEVSLVKLDDMWECGLLALPHVIKIDVEGGELDVLIGARMLLSVAKPTVFLATHGKGLHEASLSLLRELGYVIKTISAADRKGWDCDALGVAHAEILARHEDG